MRSYIIGAITAALLAGFGLSDTADAARARVRYNYRQGGYTAHYHGGYYRPYYRPYYYGYYRPYYYGGYVNVRW